MVIMKIIIMIIIIISKITTTNNNKNNNKQRIYLKITYQSCKYGNARNIGNKTARHFLQY